MNRKQGAAGSREPTSKKSSQGISKTSTKPKGKQPQKCANKPPQHAYPAFSVPSVPPTVEEVQKAVQKVIRRNKSPGEDIKKLTDIVRSIENREIEVQEFVALVAPSTGDNGETMQSILATEVSVFQKVTRKIYDTIGEDISEVLANEHIQYRRFTDERYSLCLDKIHRFIHEIQSMCPEFDYDKYMANENYLDEVLPLEQTVVDAEAEEALMRQATYHRYQWLKSEGERLKEENERLKKRLLQLKAQQRAEMKAVVEKEEQTEDTRQELAEEQTDLEDRLQQLNESVGKILVSAEVSEAKAVSPQQVLSTPKDPKARKVPTPKPSWASQQAAEIESEKASEVLEAQRSKLATRSKTSMGKGKKRVASKRSVSARKPPAPSEGPTSPFHFSPVKSPPSTTQQQSSQQSPFHFSPIKSPPVAQSGRPASPFHYSPVKTPTAAAQSRGPTSPFHYSPLKTPPAAETASQRSPFHYSPVNQAQAPPSTSQRSPFHYSPPRMAPEATAGSVSRRARFASEPDEAADKSVSEAEPRMRVTTSTVVTSRKTQPPRDSWGGFY